ncbi:MAG: (2Fe-2S) ferredoxin domain-containing protein [Proteobacteria bacterium]|nr:(2Fe-2S) ferredoxin domain-containing protein [Pseudomonadota bacterium]
MSETKEKVRFSVCINMVRGVDRPCCGGRGSRELLALVEKGVRQRGLNVSVETVVCLNKCLDGPNMRIIGREIISDVTDGDIPNILDRLEALAGYRHRDDLVVDERNKIVFPGS